MKMTFEMIKKTILWHFHALITTFNRRYVHSSESIWDNLLHLAIGSEFKYIQRFGTSTTYGNTKQTAQASLFKTIFQRSDAVNSSVVFEKKKNYLGVHILNRCPRLIFWSRLNAKLALEVVLL